MLQRAFQYLEAAAYLWLMTPVTLISFCLSPILHVMWMVTDQIIWRFMGRHFIYNMSWEDPRIDHKVFKLTPKDHIVTICSAGDNVLDYLIEGAKVSAVDLNSCQYALAELKVVGIKHLDFEDFFKIFAESDTRLLRQQYFKVLRPHMSALGREFWDSYVYKIRNFMYAGSSGKLAYMLFRVIFPLLGMGWIRKCIIDGVTKEQFRQECMKHKLQLQTVCWLGETFMLKACSSFAGVPKSQLQLGLHRPNNIKTIFDTVLLDCDLVHDNYFYVGYILGAYTKENCPRYLKEDCFQKLRANLNAGNLTLYHGTLHDFLMTRQSDEKFTIASLLDHLDWMSPHMINAELAELIEKMDSERGRIFWRSFSENVHSAPLLWLNPKRVDDTGDRVGMYFSTWIAELANADYTLVPRKVKYHDYSNSLIQNLLTGAKMVAFPVLHKCKSWLPTFLANLTDPRDRVPVNGHQSTMEAFYAFQKEGYDAFREGLLHARPVLMDVFPVNKKGGMVWVDIGAGTARNLEFFPAEVILKYFSKIYVVDISPSLLEVAKRRVQRLGLESVVTIVEADCTAPFETIKGLPSPGTVDVVTMSYSLSMIPDKAACIKNCIKMLKPRGLGCLMVADFFLKKKGDSKLPPYKKILRKAEQQFHKMWFQQDNVHLLSPADLKVVVSQTETLWDDRFRGSIPFLPGFRPVHGVILTQTR